MKSETISVESIIRHIRGQKVILDVDLARLYGVSTGAFNQAVKRNAFRFPRDFMFQLTREEYDSLRQKEDDLKSQIVISSLNYGGRRSLPNAFTEHGAIMAASVLNSPVAVQASIFVVRAFMHMRMILAGRRELMDKLSTLEKKLTERLDVHEVAIVDILRRLMELIDPPPAPVPPSKKPIGFHT